MGLSALHDQVVDKSLPTAPSTVRLVNPVSGKGPKRESHGANDTLICA